jgi:hypothetical protein
VAEPAFTPTFLRRVAELERTASTAELTLLDRTLAGIVSDPFLPERFPTFYDPALPTFFVRAGPFLIEFHVDEESEDVTFISLFYRSP